VQLLDLGISDRDESHDVRAGYGDGTVGDPGRDPCPDRLRDAVCDQRRRHVAEVPVAPTRVPHDRFLGRADRPGPPPTPDRLLAGRFARGEIDEEEYRRRLDAMRAADGSRASG
jgi:hypothetical protein